MRSSGKRNAGLSRASTTFSHQFQLQDKASLHCQFQAYSEIYTEPSDNLCVLTDSYHVQYYCQQIDLASSSQKSNGKWFFRHFFAPYLFHRTRSNRHDKLRSKFWRERNVQKTTLEAALTMLGPWNQQNTYIRHFH